MAAIKSQCPKCRKILKLKTKAALGKRVPCPQCSEPFIVEEYEQPELVDNFLDDQDEGETFDYAGYEEASGGGGGDYDDYGDDDYDDYGDDDYGGDDYDDYEDDYDSPPKRKSKASSGKKKSSKSKKKKKKSGGGMPAWAPMALIGAGAVAVIGGIVGALIAFGPFGGSANVVDLAWMPADADMYMEVKPSEMWNAGVLAPVRNNASVKQALTQMQQTGQPQIQPGDITSITVAVSGIEGGGMPMGNPLAMAGGGGAGTKTLAVVRVSKNMDEGDLQKTAQRMEHNGKEYYKALAGDQAMYMPDSKTLLVGSESMLTAAIDRGSAEPRVEWMDFADSGHQFLLVAKVPANSGMPAQDEIGSTLQQAKAAYLAIDLGSDIEISGGVNCGAEADATLLKTKLDEQLAKLKTDMETKLGQVPPQFAGLADIGKSTVNSISGSASGSVLTVSVEIPGTIGPEIEKLSKDPMMGMMLGGLMAQGMGGFGGPPGFGGGGPQPGIPNSGRPGATGSTAIPGSPAAQKAMSKNNLTQLMLAVHNYHDVYNKFPESAITGPDGTTKHSWRVALLPFLEQRDLYEEYKLEEPWDSPNNRKVLAKMPAVFRNPTTPPTSTDACYLGLVGPDTAMGADLNSSRAIKDIADGSSNTIFLVEAKRNIPWTKPEDIPYAEGSPVPSLGGFHAGGFHVALADGVSRFQAASTNQAALRKLMNRHDTVAGNAASSPTTTSPASPRLELPPLGKPPADSLDLSNPIAKAQDAAKKAESSRNLSVLGRAFHTYRETSAKSNFPGGINVHPKDKGKHSWRVAILPFLGDDDAMQIARRYRYNEPWDSTHNRQFLDEMPDIYRHPYAPKDSIYPSYFLLSGAGTAGGTDTTTVRMRDIKDGMANTILLIEGWRDIPWTKPEDIPVNPTVKLPKFGGYHLDGANIVVVDGRVKFLPLSTPETTIRALITISGGETINQKF